MSQKHDMDIKVSNVIAHYVNITITGFYSALVGHLSRYCVQFLTLHWKDAVIMEKVQKRAMWMIRA